MSEQKHTPGEWTYEPHGNTVALYAGRTHGMNGRHGLRLMNLDDGDSNFEANARLIAAAPDMLEALKMVRGMGWPEGKKTSNDELFDIVDAAISKALTP